MSFPGIKGTPLCGVLPEIPIPGRGRLSPLLYFAAAAVPTLTAFPRR
jgi:hypothetical protein